MFDSSSTTTDLDSQLDHVTALVNQQPLALIHQLLQNLTDYSYELKWDGKVLLIHHGLKTARKIVLHEVILSALFGLASCYEIKIIRIEGYDPIQISDGIKHVKELVHSR